jgi:hypothetical protein
MQYAETNGCTGPKTSRRRNLSSNYEGEGKRRRARFFEELSGCFVNYARRPMLAPARNCDKVVKAQGDAQAIEARTQIGSAGRNLNSDFFHHPKRLERAKL